jgi:hypothetical protein
MGIPKNREGVSERATTLFSMRFCSIFRPNQDSDPALYFYIEIGVLAPNPGLVRKQWDFVSNPAW